MDITNKSKERDERSKGNELDSKSEVQEKEIHKGSFSCEMSSYQCEKKITLTWNEDQQK